VGGFGAETQYHVCRRRMSPFHCTGRRFRFGDGFPELRQYFRPHARSIGRIAPTLVIGYSIYMTSRMTAKSLQAALLRLGRTLRENASLTLGGSAALLLTGALDRLTDDGDVVESSVDFATLLDADYRSRLVHLPRMGRLDVSLLGRPDVILMKTYAHNRESPQ